MAEKSKKPAIRFAGFTEAWEQRKLSGLANETNGGGTPKTSVDSYWNGNIPWIQSSDIKENEVLAVDIKKTISQEAISNSATKLIPKNSIAIVTRVGVGKLAIIPFSYTTSQDFLSLSGLKTDLVFTAYLLYKKMQSDLNSVQGTAIKGITKEELLNKNILLPELAEQDLIGKYFQQLDNLITLHQRKYDKLVNVKKAMLEKMFPKDGADVPEIRFKGFTEAWEQRKLDEIVSFFSGLTYSPNDIRPTGTLVLRSSNVKDGEVIDADNVYVDPSVVNSDNVHDGDIIVVVRNGSRTLIGKHAEIKGLMPNTVIGAFMTGIRSEHPSFLNSLLSTPHFDKEIERNMGATINQITGYMFSKMEFMIPSSKEQDAIGEYFKRISNLITLHQRKLEKLKNLKKACLEKMFV